MIHALQRHIVIVIGMMIAGFICLQAAGYLMSPRGDMGPLVLQSGSPFSAMAAVVVCVALAAVVASAVGRMINAAVGLFVLGAGLFVLDGRLDTMREFALSVSGISPSWPLILLAVEGVFWCVLVMAATWFVFAIAGPLKDIEPNGNGRRPNPLMSGAALKCAACGVLMLAAVLVIARSPMKGQMIGVTFLGGTMAGLVGRLISPHVQPLLCFASPILFGAFGYVIAGFMLKTPLDEAFVSRSLPGLVLPTPLDYAAGSLMGVAFGLGWARSFLHHEETAPSGAVAAS